MQKLALFALASLSFLAAGAGACSATIVEAPPAADGGAKRPEASAAARPEGLPASCWKPEGTPCNPVSGEGCSGDTFCEYSSTETDISIVCVSAGAGAALGAKCAENVTGACGAGLRCMGGTCAKICCATSECGSGESCEAFESPLGTLGACLRPSPTCAKAGRDCAKNADCCSGDCHSGHCH